MYTTLLHIICTHPQSHKKHSAVIITTDVCRCMSTDEYRRTTIDTSVVLSPSKTICTPIKRHTHAHSAHTHIHHYMCVYKQLRSVYIRPVPQYHSTEHTGDNACNLATHTPVSVSNLYMYIKPHNRYTLHKQLPLS